MTETEGESRGDGGGVGESRGHVNRYVLETLSVFIHAVMQREMGGDGRGKRREEEIHEAGGANEELRNLGTLSSGQPGERMIPVGAFRSPPHGANAGDCIVPHHVAILENARDGLRAVGLNEALLAQERDGTAQLKALTKAFTVNWHARLEGRQTLKVESVPVTKTCPLPFAISWDSGISTTALFRLSLLPDLTSPLAGLMEMGRNCSQGAARHNENQATLQSWCRWTTIAVHGNSCHKDDGVIVVLQLKVREDQGNGVSWLGQHSPGAVGIVVVLSWVIGGGDHTTLTPQCPATPIIRCREHRREKVLKKLCNGRKCEHI
ncbi:hypothetical protein EYF80_001615 [Liparis tanakae]|uniref:Uncharacterized protein n=1 Tax=Liparis tanakae TaxID=230148 RepID=A0A4Z2JDW6_9TELE|nr:hypothetical protein EYF80_001615 [Liparis tanakae]